MTEEITPIAGNSVNNSPVTVHVAESVMLQDVLAHLNAWKNGIEHWTKDEVDTAIEYLKTKL